GPGLRTERVLSMRIDVNWSKHRTAADFRRFYSRLLEQVENLPGVLSAAVATSFPFQQSIAANTGFQIEGRPLADGEPRPLAAFRSISGRYFETLGTPLLAGRSFTAADDEEAPAVAIINASLQQHRFAGDYAIGRRISFNRGETWATIVGVVADTRQNGLEQEPSDEVYRPFAQSPGGQGLLVRTGVE